MQKAKDFHSESWKHSKFHRSQALKFFPPTMMLLVSLLKNSSQVYFLLIWNLQKNYLNFTVMASVSSGKRWRWENAGKKFSIELSFIRLCCLIASLSNSFIHLMLLCRLHHRNLKEFLSLLRYFLHSSLQLNFQHSFLRALIIRLWTIMILSQLNSMLLY